RRQARIDADHWAVTVDMISGRCGPKARTVQTGVDRPDRIIGPAHMRNASRKAPIALEPLHPRAKFQASCFRKNRQTVRMLNARRCTWETKDEANHLPAIERSGNKAAFVLDCKQQV